MLCLVAVSMIGIGIVLIDQENSQETQVFSELRPIEPGDLAAVKRWVVLRCRGRTIEDLSRVYGVEPTMEAVAKRVTRGIPRQSREAAAAKLCERELKRSERESSRS